jgi:hypothetical protein
VKCPFLLGDMDVRISNANSGLNSQMITWKTQPPNIGVPTMSKKDRVE